jgi:hypothetical protein
LAALMGFNRLTLLNPHADDFVKRPVSFWLARRRALKKYEYLVDEPTARGETVDILIDGTQSSLLGGNVFLRLPRWLRLALLHIEIAIWRRINGFNGKLVVHWSPDTIKNRTFLYLFSYKSCVGGFQQRRAAIEQFEQKIINLSHYFIRTKEKANNIASLQNVCLVADSDIRGNSYFQRFFPADRPIIVLPFAINGRFAPRKALSERRGICAATGSLHNLNEELPKSYYRDFLDFYKSDTYHPVRKVLYSAKDELANWLTCRISLYREMDTRAAALARVMRWWRLDMQQTEYFSFDIVDFYNNHKFAIVGEELSGFPAVGSFEAAACGCVMLGQEGLFYKGLGLKANVDYLTHDGTIAGIHNAIEQTMNTPGRIDDISRAGLAYVAQHCAPSAVWDAFQDALDKLASDRKLDLAREHSKGCLT